MDNKRDEGLREIFCEFEYTSIKNCKKCIRHGWCDEIPKKLKDADYIKMEYLGDNKWTCEHEKNGEIASDCPACHIAWCEKRIELLEKKSDVVLDEGKIRIISNDILKNFPITEDMDVLNMRGIDYIRLLDKLAHAIAQSGNALVKEKGVGG